uniref:mediator of RNA polymerase II transcription subunit 1-like n=1 Tax=Myxine glutinosa TaxID=7769 RepID=UPI00358FF43C
MSDLDVQLHQLMENLHKKHGKNHQWGRTTQLLWHHMGQKLQGGCGAHQRILHCLQHLQEVLKSKSPAITGHLEDFASRAGLDVLQGTSQGDWILSNEAVQLYFQMEAGELVQTVCIKLHGETQTHNCTEMVQLLRDGHVDACLHLLDELCCFAHRPPDDHLTKRMLQSLSVMEANLMQMANSDRERTGESALDALQNGLVGHVTLRSRGFPTRLNYFVTPGEVLGVQVSSSISLSHEQVAKLGNRAMLSVEFGSICGEPLSSQVPALLSGRANGHLSSIQVLTEDSSAEPMYCFCLHFPQPVLLSSSALHFVQVSTGFSVDEEKEYSFLDLTIQLASEGDADAGRRQEKGVSNAQGDYQRYSVFLPDQHHQYVLEERRIMASGQPLRGRLVSRLRFSQLEHIPIILTTLRQQACLVALLQSCIRHEDHADLSNCYHFEVVLLSDIFLIVYFQHPRTENLMCLEVDMTNPTGLLCRLSARPLDSIICTDDFLSSVLQRCLSLPITLRALLRCVDKIQDHSNIPATLHLLPPDHNSNPNDLGTLLPISHSSICPLLL